MKVVKKVIVIFITVLLVLMATFSIYNFICLKILKQDLVTIKGYGLLEVVSGSMEPTIHVGDLIIINTNEKNYKENDIVTFYDVNGSFVTHRIVSLNDNSMVTKGDHNDSLDEATNTDKLVGKYVFRLVNMGRVLSAFRNPITMIMIFVIGVLVCVLISTDKDGKPLYTDEEKEYQEFLNYQNEKNRKKKGDKKKLCIPFLSKKADSLDDEEVSDEVRILQEIMNDKANFEEESLDIEMEEVVTEENIDEEIQEVEESIEEKEIVEEETDLEEQDEEDINEETSEVEDETEEDVEVSSETDEIDEVEEIQQEFDINAEEETHIPEEIPEVEDIDAALSTLIPEKPKKKWFSKKPKEKKYKVIMSAFEYELFVEFMNQREAMANGDQDADLIEDNFIEEDNEIILENNEGEKIEEEASTIEETVEEQNEESEKIIEKEETVLEVQETEEVKEEASEVEEEQDTLMDDIHYSIDRDLIAELKQEIKNELINELKAEFTNEMFGKTKKSKSKKK